MNTKKKSPPQKHRGFSLRYISLSWQAELALALILACAITFLEVWIQPNPLSDTLYDFRHFPVVLVLNLIPPFLMILSFSAILGNVCFGAALTDILLCTLSLANRMKVGYRNEPVWPGDLLLLQEVRSAVAEYSLDFPLKVIAAIVLSVVLLILAGLLLRHRRGETTIGRRLLRRAALLVLSAGILTAMIFTVYASDDLYYKYPRCNHYRLAAVYNELGTTYSFLHNITANAVECPDGYSTVDAVAWETASPVDLSGENVHVVMVMCEGFSDITDQGIFSFTAENDPLKNFHALTQSPNAVSGHITVSRFGGGTANTEYDVLTGMQSANLSASTSTAFYAVERNLDSLFRVYSTDQYETAYIHPGYDWFYNRRNVMAYLGAQRVDFYDDMADKEMKGTWVTDDYIASRLEQAFEATVSRGKYMFTYLTTIENHTVYSYDKFGEGYTFPRVDTTAPISADLQEIADVYVEGLRDNDAMIARLVDYFSATEEPVVLVLFGDHLPSLGGNIKNYAALGISINAEETGTEEYLRSCETPWVIWANDSAATKLDWAKAVEQLQLPENGLISASYLGAMTLELTGRGNCTPWFAWLNRQRRLLPVVCGDTVVNEAGTITNSLTGTQQEAVEKWVCWSYYKLKEKTIP